MPETTLTKNEDPESAQSSPAQFAAFNVMVAMRKALKAEAEQLAVIDSELAGDEHIDPFREETHAREILSIIEGFFNKYTPQPHHLDNRYIEHYLGIPSET